MLLLSGIGEPYDPSTGEGVIGRNYSYQVTSSVDAFFDGQDLQSLHRVGRDRHVHRRFQRRQLRSRTTLGFVGGGYIGAVQTNGRPIAEHPTLPGTPSWGAEWKKAVAQNYLRSISRL